VQQICAEYVEHMPLSNHSMTSSALRPQLQTALMRQMGQSSSHKKNLLQKGFTLVELMIVIVIVGILSAVALPNFLNQTSKAKATEPKTKVSALLKQAQAEALSDTAANAVTLMNTATTGPVAVATGTGNWTYTMASGATATDDIVMTATPKAGTAAAGITAIQGCVDVQTGAVQIDQSATAKTSC
jgi:type IV pilus assembly protein PilA